MAQNKSLERGTPLQVAVPAAAAVKSGQLLLLGSLGVVANENDGDATRPSTGMVSVDAEGCFDLTVTAATVLSPLTGSDIKPGDNLYLEGGTADATTGITYGGIIDKNSSGKRIGIAVSKTGASGVLLASGTTGTVTVRLSSVSV